MPVAQSLPDNFITINPLSLKQSDKDEFRCLICKADSVYMCRICHSCYCCREHLDQDNQACHELICELKHIINDINQLPLAEQNRSKVKQQLRQLQDQCRQICYLQSKKHILNNNLIYALPAAERSLEYAIKVNGPNNMLLVNPLLALADVSSAAGSKQTALENINRAQLLIEMQYKKIMESHDFHDRLTNILKQNINSMLGIDPNYCSRQLTTEIDRERRHSRLSSRIDMNNSNTFRSSSIGRRSSISSDGEDSAVVRIMQSSLSGPKEGGRDAKEVLLQQQFSNYSKEEIYKYQLDGQSLAGYRLKLHQSKASVFYHNHDFMEALYEQSSAVYYAALCYGTQSLQMIQQLGYLLKYGKGSDEFTDERCQWIQQLINQFFVRQICQHFSHMLNQMNMLKSYYFLKDDDYSSPALLSGVREFLIQRGVPEETRLSFQGDVKEALKMVHEAKTENEDVDLLLMCNFLATKIIEAEDPSPVKQQGIDFIKKFLSQPSDTTDTSLYYINQEESRVWRQRKLIKEAALYTFAEDLIKAGQKERKVDERVPEVVHKDNEEQPAEK